MSQSISHRRFRDAVWRRLRHSTKLTTLIVAAYLLVAALPFVIAETHSWFWRGPHYPGPGSAALFVILLVAVVLRQRWAWLMLVVFNGFVLVSYIWDWSSAPAFSINVASFALLISPPMRHYVHRR
jgi:hypothetical protein